MLDQHSRVAFAVLLEPPPGNPMGERPVVVGEHRVGRFPHQRVPEGQLVLARESAFAPRAHELTPLERREPVLHARDGVRSLTELGFDGPAPERGSKHARRPEHAPRVRLERVQAVLHHRKDGVGEVIPLPFGDGAQDLFEEECVARRARHGPLEHFRGHVVAEHVTREAHRCFGRQLAERHIDRPVLLP